LAYYEGVAVSLIEDMERIRDTLLAVGVPSPPAGISLVVPRVLAGNGSCTWRPCPSPDQWKAELVQAIKDCVIEHKVLQARCCSLGSEHQQAMREAERLCTEGKDGGGHLMAFQEGMRVEVVGLRKRALAAQDRFNCFHYQIKQFGAAEMVVPAAPDPPQPIAEEWLPNSEAVKRAERAGFEITLSWLSRPPQKSGIKRREAQLPGDHRGEVEWNSLAGYLMKTRAEGRGFGADNDQEEPSTTELERIEAEKQKAKEKKQRGRPT
jgi:hypothetical protein